MALCLLTTPLLHSHCQMPCGIYHDDMVFDQVDQYVETMVKAITVLNESKFATPQQRNEFVRWVETKERMSNEAAQLILTYFLQQKIKPGEDDTVKRITCAHTMLCTLTTIKQTVDMNYVKSFAEEWEKFKLMFHIEGYECKMEKKKLAEWDKKIEVQKAGTKANGLSGVMHTHDGHTHAH